MASASLPQDVTALPNGVNLPPRRKWSILLVLSLALAIIILDTTILNVALSSIIRDLHTDIQKIQWVITAYSLTLAALTITGGRLGDLFGRKRMFVVGALLFAVGSFLASISTNVGMLIAGEAIIEGIGAALMMPATASLLVVNFQGRERAIAFGVWGGIAGAAAALGPILGGYLSTHYNWRWGFRINLFVVFLLIIGSVLIPESRDTKEKKELDFIGVVLSALGLLALVFGIIEASTYGWWKAKAAFVIGSTTLTLPWGLSIVPLCVFVGAIILVLFGLWENHCEKKGHTPLVSMKIFQNMAFSAGVSTTAVMSLGQTGLIFALPVFLQSVRGMDAFHTGLSLLPMSLALLVIAPLSAVLSKKIPGKILINAGLLINVGAYLLLRHTLNIDTTSTDLIPGLALFGAGMGLVMSQINNLTLSAVPIHQAGEASGINNTIRQVGATLGSAIIGTVLIGTLGSHLVDGVNASIVIPEAMKPQIASAVQSQSSNVEFGGGAQLNDRLPPVLQTEIIRIGHEATVEANRSSLLYGALFAVLGFFVSLFLPSVKKTKTATAPLASVVIPPARATSSSPEITTGLVAELIQADLSRRAEGKLGLGTDVRLLLDAASADEPILQTAGARFVQARVLWDKGFGTSLGFVSFKEYVASIPPVPVAFMQENEAYPYLILVDARVSVQEASAHLAVGIRGNEQTAALKELSEKGEVYWVRVNDGEKLRGQSVKEAEASFGLSAAGLSMVEGLALLAQQPETVNGRYLDLTRSLHDGFENSTACLGVWDEKQEIRFRWRDHADARCQAPSKYIDVVTSNV